MLKPSRPSSHDPCPPHRRRMLSASELTDYSMARSGRSTGSHRSRYCQSNTLTKSHLFETINGRNNPESHAKNEMSNRNLEKELLIGTLQISDKMEMEMVIQMKTNFRSYRDDCRKISRMLQQFVE